MKLMESICRRMCYRRLGGCINSRCMFAGACAGGAATCLKGDDVKPQIVILAGDDTDALGLTPICIKVKTDLDLNGCKIIFRFLGFSQTFTTFVKDPDDDSYNLQISMTSEQTRSFPLGYQNATIEISDTNDRTRTLNNSILVLVTDDTDKAYDIRNTVSVGVPASISTLLAGKSWYEGGTIRSMRDFLGEVGKALGADITDMEEP